MVARAGDQKVIAAAVNLTKDAQLDVRLAAVQVLPEVAHGKDLRAITAAIDCTEHLEPQMKQVAMQVLLKLVQFHPQLAIKMMIARLGNEDPYAKRQIRDALVSFTKVNHSDHAASVWARSGQAVLHAVFVGSSSSPSSSSPSLSLPSPIASTWHVKTPHLHHHLHHRINHTAIAPTIPTSPSP
eukprot:gnl/MRDRNA2_/MRDRNA2_159465_c0_seq1.p1 gnl/MRDRNA2_/MRDRNA2_159465_c0~~gnl/MRDRNA2_/MRDRNA2_159465_c0_seq1.p1  ORF type:complete len:184 (+),score=28.22 gnl/MRDRNA2_/MRDRNA2_159465_c0_seq1:2-553(+)